MGPGPRDKGRGDFRSRGPSVKRALARSGGVQAGRWGWKRPISQTAAIGHLEAINRVSITILCPLHPLHALLGSTLYGRGRQRLSPGQGYYNGGPGQHPLLFPLCEEGRSGQSIGSTSNGSIHSPREGGSRAKKASGSKCRKTSLRKRELKEAG